MRLKSVKIVLTFFLLWVTTQFDIAIENYLAYFFVLSLGILHGSNDLKIIRSLHSFQNKSFKRILIMYVSVVMCTLFAFLILPKIALILFILISGYHFGEQHFMKKVLSKNRLTYLLFITYGLLIFSMIFYANFEDVSIIIQDITNAKIAQDYYRYSMLFLLIFVFFIIFVVQYKKILTINILEEYIYLLLFFILFMNSTLLWSFAIYFIVWHSLPSMIDQIARLYGNVSSASTIKYLKASLVYWVISIIGIFGILFVTKNDEKLFNLLFVAFLAAITFPHVVVVSKMNT